MLLNFLKFKEMENCECVCQAALTIAQQVQLFCGGMAFAVPLIVTSIIVRAAKAGGMVND